MNKSEATTQKITISKQAGDWYLSCSYEFTLTTTPKTTEVVGVDLGIKTLATLSTGEVFKSMKPYKKAQNKLAKLQRQLSRKVKHSSNWYKAVVKLAKQHRRVANIRLDALHKLTTYLAKNHGIVVIEDLNVSGMLANHKLAKSIADQGFYELRRQLEYKCQWYGCELVVVERFFPSSKTCSSCGHVQDMPLNIRTYDCPECGLSIDRDLNASINLRKRVCNSEETSECKTHLRSAVSLTVDACGRSAADSSGGSRK